MIGSLTGLLFLFTPYGLAQYRYYLRQQNQPLSNQLYPSLAPTDSPLWPEHYLPQVGQDSRFAKGSWLVIPKLGVTVPVVANVDTTAQRFYNQALKKGIGHMKGTAALTADRGNSFIFGHSSRFTSSGTPYDTVFATLPKLTAGDEVELVVEGQKQRFVIEVSKATSPNDLSVTKSKNYRQLTLMTCWPLGTTLSRWIVQAKEL